MIDLSDIYKTFDREAKKCLSVTDDLKRDFEFTDKFGKTFQGKLFKAYSEDDTDDAEIYVMPSYSFGVVDEGELGYYGSSPRPSVYILTLSVGNVLNIDNMLELSENIEKYFKRKTIDDCINCQDPYTTMIGKVTTVDRFSCYVTVPFVTWTENQQ